MTVQYDFWKKDGELLLEDLQQIKKVRGKVQRGTFAALSEMLKHIQTLNEHIQLLEKDNIQCKADIARIEKLLLKERE